MRNHSFLAVLALAAIGGLFLAGCSNNSTNPRFGTMNVRMTDDPGNFDHVNLVITQVSTRMEDADTTGTDSTEGGWVVLKNSAATYDLIALQNGVFATIGTGALPAGHYTQIRLKLGAGSTVVVDGVTYPLTVPSGRQSGLKLVGNFDVPAGGTIDVALDFDASRSIHQTGAGQYMLKPVIKILSTRVAGSITGHIAPAGQPATIYAFQSPDTLGSARAGADGSFTLAVLSPGVYEVAVRPDSAYRDTSLTNVSVVAGQTTNVGTVQLTHQ